MKSMGRVLRYDGVLPMKMNDDGSFAQMTPAVIQAMKTFIDEQRSETTPFDIVMEGETPGDDREKAAATVRPLAGGGGSPGGGKRYGLPQGARGEWGTALQPQSR